jgi:hypothetical protein
MTMAENSKFLTKYRTGKYDIVYVTEIMGMCIYVRSTIAREGINHIAPNLACLCPEPRGDFREVRTPKMGPGFESRWEKSILKGYAKGETFFFQNTTNIVRLPLWI